MGGFEGGDEGGFWDIDILDEQNTHTSQHVKKAKTYIERSGSVYSIKAYAKSAIPAENGYDTISFVPNRSETFTLESPLDIPVEKSSIYKAYRALIDYTADPDIEEFFCEHKVVVTEGIASSADQVCTASHTAAFMLLLKELCNLILSNAELAKIGNAIDSDVGFFIHNYPFENDLHL